MGLLDQARADAHQILTNADGWGTSIQFTSEDGQTVKTVTGLAMKHHLGMDGAGAAVNTKTTKITVTEKALKDAGFPTRNGNDELSFSRVRVEWADASGTTKTYVIKQWYPDETLGVLLFQLVDFK
jgi:hypothetical protein